MSDKDTAQGLAELFGLRVEADKAGNFDESKHPRAPAGSSSGGEFTSAGGGGESPDEAQLSEKRGEVRIRGSSVRYNGRVIGNVRRTRNGFSFQSFADGRTSPNEYPNADLAARALAVHYDGLPAGKRRAAQLENRRVSLEEERGTP